MEIEIGFGRGGGRNISRVLSGSQHGKWKFQAAEDKPISDFKTKQKSIIKNF
jgi:hypothetical protein